MTAGKINDKKNEDGKEFSVKVYEPKVSMLTELFDKDKYLKSLYNLCFSITVCIIISTAITNYQKEKKFYLGSKIISNAFQNFDVATLAWVCLFISTNLVYGGFMIWATLRKKLTTASKLWDMLWLFLYILYYPLILFYSSKLVVTSNLGVASSITVLMEATRFLMKAHAFIRSNCPKYLQKDKEELHPTYAHYIYFSFAPIAVYKDSYPRSIEAIKWKNVFKWFLELLTGIIFFSILFDKAYRTPLKDCGLKTYSLMDVFAVQIQNIHIGIILLLLFFYTGFHCYLNAMGEILKFSDRCFYEDWWVATTADGFLKKWNVFVYDWLYVYIYKECYNNVFKKNRTLSRMMVFGLSAVFHDFVICFSSRIYTPLNLIAFTCLIILVQLRSSIGNINNICLWLGLGFIVSGLLTFSTAEYFARTNCHIDALTVFDNLKLRFLYC